MSEMIVDRPRNDRRRVLCALAAGALTAIPVAGIAAPARIRRLGVLCQDDGSWAKERLPALWKELGEFGFEEGRDFIVQVCAAQARKVSVPDCAAILVNARSDLIYTQNTRNTRALQEATRTIPVVTSVADPVGSGFAANLARPGANITGVDYGDPDLELKLLELARLLIPRLSSAVILTQESYVNLPEFLERLQGQVSKAGVTCRVVFAVSVKAAEHEFRSMRQRGERLVIADRIGWGSNEDVAAIAQSAIRSQIALVSGYDFWVRAGGLLSHTLTHRNEDRSLASQIALILNGANPSTVPFVLPDATEIVVNRTTAAKLGIRIPPEVLIAATEIIG